MLLVIGLVPFTSARALADDHEEHLEELEDELAETEETLTAALERLDDARAELERVEARLAAASAELGRTQEAYNAAKAAYEAARQEVEETSAALAGAERALARAESRLEAALERERVAVGRLEDRVVKAFKDGSTHPTVGLAQGIISAGDWHDIARTAQIYQRTLADDRQLVSEAYDARTDADAARADADAARIEAEELAIRAEVAEQRAAEELATLDALVAERQAAVNAVAAEQRQRQAIFQELEADADVMRALQRELEQKILELRAGGTCVGSVPAGAPVPSSIPSWGQRLVSRTSAARDWVIPIAAASSRNGLDPRVFAALVWSESAFRPTVVSHAGAIGLAQLMPGTAAGLGVDPWDPEENLDGGSRYLARQVSRFGSLELGLAAYNAGPGNVVKYGGIPPFAETQIYVVRVIERCQLIS
ncbi:MAG: transglycosylase SLT domain-containing protein [Nitriliruptoraceae bacterium]